MNSHLLSIFISTKNRKASGLIILLLLLSLLISRAETLIKHVRFALTVVCLDNSYLTDLKAKVSKTRKLFFFFRKLFLNEETWMII